MSKAGSLLWNAYIEHHHYLGHQPLPGAQLRYFVRAEGHIIAARLLHVAHLARIEPDRPATQVFSAVEIQVLHLRVTQALPPVAPALTLREVVRLLGRLGGHLGRKGDGEPGVLVLWRGWMRLYESVEMLHTLQSAGLVDAR